MARVHSEQFKAIVLHGSSEEMRGFLSAVDADTRTELFNMTATFASQTHRNATTALTYCLRSLLLDMASVLFEFGAFRTSPTASSFCTAVHSAVLFNYMPVLDMVVSEARRLDCLPEAISNARHPYLLKPVLAADAAPVLEFLLDVCLEVSAAQPTIAPSDAGLAHDDGDAASESDGTEYDAASESDSTEDDAEDGTEGDTEGDGEEDDADEYSLDSDEDTDNVRVAARRETVARTAAKSFHAPFVTTAAELGAVACLRVLHRRCPREEWRALFAADTPAAVRDTPYALAFKEARHEVCDFVFSTLFGESSDVGADAAATADADAAAGEAADAGAGTKISALIPAALEEKLYDHRRLRADAARAERGAWDARTRLDAAVALAIARSPSKHPSILALSCGFPRAAAVLARLAYGVRSEWRWPPLAEASTADMARAVLDINTAKDVAWLVSHAARTGAAGTDAGGVVVDGAAVRRDIIEGRSCWNCTYEERSNVFYLVEAGHGEAALVLLECRPALSAQSIVQTLVLIPRQFAQRPAEGLRVARALLATLGKDACADAAASAGAAAGADAGVEERAELRALLYKSSYTLLLDALDCGHFALASLLADNGADVFSVSDCSYPKDLIAGVLQFPLTELPLRALQLAPPPIADPAVAAATGARYFPSLAAAHAHAQRAEAEEVRILAAVLEDPDYIVRGTGPAWESWAKALRRALACRWVWQRQCAQTPWLRVVSSDEKDETQRRRPLHEAINAGDVRCVRFFTSQNMRFHHAYSPDLARACRLGVFELAWALLAALPIDAAERARGLAMLNQKLGVNAVSGVVAAVNSGHPFCAPLADSLVAAGGRAHLLLVRVLVARQAMNFGIPPLHRAPALRWALNHFKAICSEVQKDKSEGAK